MSETTKAVTPPAGPPGSPPAAPDERPDNGSGLTAYVLGHQSWFVIAVALIGSAVIGGALIRYQGFDPIYAYKTLFSEALFVDGGLTRTLTKTAPLVLTGLAVVLPLRVGLFNIGDVDPSHR